MPAYAYCRSIKLSFTYGVYHMHNIRLIVMLLGNNTFEVFDVSTQCLPYLAVTNSSPTTPTLTQWSIMMFLLLLGFSTHVHAETLVNEWHANNTGYMMYFIIIRTEDTLMPSSVWSKDLSSRCGLEGEHIVLDLGTTVILNS